MELLARWFPRPPHCPAHQPDQFQPRDPTKTEQAAARTFGLELHVLTGSTERDFETVFAALIQLRAGALVVGQIHPSESEQATRRTGGPSLVPAIFQYREFPVAGGLMSYGGNF